MSGEVTTDRPSVCGLATYGELSARNKLARHRKRTDYGVSAWFCDACGAWHVTRTEDEE